LAVTILTPEARADKFARRWLMNESPQIRDIGRREIAALIREAIEEAAVRDLDRSSSTPH
jgi:hypothetical protein